MPNIYGPHLKEIREKRGIKAIYVAWRLKVSKGSYSEIESGKRGLSAERLRDILCAIGCTMHELYDRARTAVTDAWIRLSGAQPSKPYGSKPSGFLSPLQSLQASAQGDTISICTNVLSIFRLA